MELNQSDTMHLPQLPDVRVQGSLVRPLIGLRRYLAYLAIVMTMIMMALPADMQVFINHGRATAPFTSLCVIVISLGFLSVIRRMALGVIWLSVALSLVALMSDVVLTPLDPHRAPQLANQVNSLLSGQFGGAPMGEIGADTALVLLSLFLSVIAGRSYASLSLGGALVANILLSNSLFALSYGAGSNATQMSWATAASVMPISVLAILMHLERSWLHVLLRKNKIAIRAWLQILGGLFIPGAGGLILRHSTPDEVAFLQIDSIVITVISWCIIIASVHAAVGADLTMRKHQYALRAMVKELVTDPLTGLLNRKGLEQHLDRRWGYFDRTSVTCAVLILDLDHFKRINDTFGHVAGDQVLASLGKTLQNCLRVGDQAGRWGGEEFLVLINVTQHDEIRTMAERIRLAVAQVHLPFPASGGAISAARITVSCGYSVFQVNDRSYEPAFKRADVALYRAKELGRNRVEGGTDVINLVARSA